MQNIQPELYGRYLTSYGNSVTLDEIKVAEFSPQKDYVKILLVGQEQNPRWLSVKDLTKIIKTKLSDPPQQTHGYSFPTVKA